MSLVENLLNQISANGLGGITKPQGFDLNDDTFEKLLQNMTNIKPENELNSNLQVLGQMGQPSGLMIEPFTEDAEVKPAETDNFAKIEPIQIKDVDIGTDYFSNLLKEAPQEHKNIMNVAKKYAAGAYNTFGKNLVENLADFAKDLTALS